MTLLELLTKARARISNPEHWTQGEAARDKNGNPTDLRAMSAVCWCAVGAIKFEMTDESSQFIRAMCALSGIAETGFVTNYNDTHTHDEVIALFDKAIDQCRA